VRVPTFRDDEFGEVAVAFNTMASAVEQSMTSLRQSNDELRKLDRFRDEFLSTVTHELKTPLTSILGFARMLERGTNGPISEAQRQSVGRIIANTKHLHQLVSDLLDVTAIRQGKLSLRKAAEPLGSVVHETVALLAPEAERKQVAMVEELGPLPALQMDAGRIGQVLTNLLANAMRFSPEGGRITVRVAAGGGEVRVEVEDEGPGVSDEAMARLFEPFAHGERGGTGLGLSICKAIVEAHGGAIGVVTAPGQGSTFWFTLPAAA
jgi:signal transduction histidine kinase